MAQQISRDLALKLPDFELSVNDAGGLRLAGALTAAKPDPTLVERVAAIHRAAGASGIERLDVDIRELKFVNSCGIRLFVDWALRIKNDDSVQRYRLRFVADREITWQRMSLKAIESLAREVIEVSFDT